MAFEEFVSRMSMVFVIFNWQFVISNCASSRPASPANKGQTSPTGIPQSNHNRISFNQTRRDIRYVNAWNHIISRVEHLDPMTPPNFRYNKPTDVSVSIFIQDFDHFDEGKMQITISLFLRTSWIDYRIAYEDLAPYLEFKRLELNTEEARSSMWLPTLFFRREKKSVTNNKNILHELVHVYPNGTVYYTTRRTVTLGCNMNLQNFPFDHQACFINLTSFEYSMSFLQLVWDNYGVTYGKQLMLREFEVTSPQMTQCQPTSDFTKDALYSCLGVRFGFRRNCSYYITSTYLPMTLFVILSWLSFWLDVDAVPARITLGLLMVLTMTTQTATITRDFAKVSYVKAIDIWAGVCLVFVFAALIEFAYVNVNSRIEDRQVAERLVARMDRRSDAEDRLMGGNQIGDGDILTMLTEERLERAASLRTLMGSSEEDDRKESIFTFLKRKTYLPQTMMGSQQEDREFFSFLQRKTYSSQTVKESEVDPQDLLLKAQRIKTHSSKTDQDADLVTVDGDGQDEVSQVHQVKFDIEESEGTSSEKIKQHPSAVQICSAFMSSPFGYLIHKARVGRTRAKQIDRMARLIFPLAFIIFNVGYWSFYLFANEYEIMQIFR